MSKDAYSLQFTQAMPAQDDQSPENLIDFSTVSANHGRAKCAGRFSANQQLVDRSPAPFIWHLDVKALERISADPRTEAAVLVELASYPHPDIRAIVAENNNTPEQTRCDLINDENPNVRYQLAESPYLPVALLQILANDENPYVACRAQRTISRVQAENGHC